MNQLLNNGETSKRFIGTEELEVLRDIKCRCFYPSLYERKKFERIVCESVNATSFQTILEDDFEAAFNCAINILRNRGEMILRGRISADFTSENKVRS